MSRSYCIRSCTVNDLIITAFSMPHKRILPIFRKVSYGHFCPICRRSIPMCAGRGRQKTPSFCASLQFGSVGCGDRQVLGDAADRVSGM